MGAECLENRKVIRGVGRIEKDEIPGVNVARLFS